MVEEEIHKPQDKNLIFIPSKKLNLKGKLNIFFFHRFKTVTLIFEMNKV